MNVTSQLRAAAAASAGITALAVFLTPAAASAKDIVINVSNGPSTGSRTTGPAHVFFVGINPFKYANDPNALKVSHTPSAAPTPPAALIGGTGVGGAGGAGRFSALATARTASDLDSPDKISKYLDGVDDLLTTTRNDIATLAIAVDRFAGSKTPAHDVTDAKTDPAWAPAKDDVDTLKRVQMNVLNGLPSQIRKLGGTDAVVTALVTRATADAAAAQQVMTTYPLLLTGARDSDFERDSDVDCAGLGAGGDTVTLTLTLTTLTTPAQSVTSDTQVNCPSRIAVSGGFIFSSLPQRTFSAQATNSALPAPPAGAATPPPATVQESVSSSIRPVPFAFVHYGLSRVCADQCMFVSFGAGVNSGGASGSTTVDFAGGLTYGLSRYLYLTAGVHVGQVTELTSGYTVGGPIASSTTTVPTQTRMRAGPFIGVTFGGH